MNKIAFYITFFLMPFFLASQNDTINVQTFAWDSDTRSGNFVFPDASEGPFEKILMTYNMRCHDALVGNFEVGCREWDYSCNTFITVPELRDSTFRKHPSYLISNFNGNTFVFSNTPVYNYFEFEQFETTYTNTNSESTAQLGNGEALTSLNNELPSSKSQWLFTADELSSAGLTAGGISGLRLDVSNANGPLNFMRLRIKNTNQNELNAATPEQDEFLQVYFRHTTLADGWNSFNFHTPFSWNGGSNLLVEMSFYHAEQVAALNATATSTALTSVLTSSGVQEVLSFNGAGQVDIPADPLQSISSEITISMWTRGDEETLPVNTTLFEGKDDSNNREVNVHLPWENSRVYWDCGGAGAGYDRIDKAADLSDFAGQWHHWAFTKNAATGEMKIFLDGALWHSGTGKTNLIDISNFALAPANRYYGQISELRIFNKALEENTIQEWMRKAVDATHPDYANLVAYYPLNEGSGNQVQDHSSFAQVAMISGSPGWQELRAKDYFKDFSESTLRPNTIFVQGEYQQTTETIVVRDSVLKTQNEVITFEVDASNNLMAIDTSYYFEGGGSYVYDEQGNIIDYVDAPIDGTFDPIELTYYDKRDAKLELLSMVTPYGNGLDLGVDGKTFTFDVSDFMPILHGERFLSIEMGGQWQEDLDIEFLFIKGTPPHDVLRIENVWPFARGWYADIQNQAIFEPRMMSFDEAGSSYKLRSSITGHGANGEFRLRNHFLNIGGGSQDFVYPVWKTCGDNPVYPQGGTWLIDRAGWCPGMATDVHEYDITDLITVGGATSIDYGVNGAFLSEANYLVSSQLVTYGAPNFNLDASIEEIRRPSKRVEYERINPACNLPLVMIKNTGAQTLTSLEIAYSVEGGGSKTYSWTGNLEFLETEIVELPIDDFHFWDTSQENKNFVVSLSQPNGSADEYANNNTLKSDFEPVEVFDDPEIFLRTKTNNNGFENSYTIKDHSGNVVMSRSGMSNNTTYEDDILLPAGCYTFHFVDNGGDGLEFWFHPGAGEGALSFRKRFTQTVSGLVERFDPDFGNNQRFDFIVPISLANEDIEHAQRLSVFPNPTRETVSIELLGYDNQLLTIQLHDLTGRILKTEVIDHHFDTQTHPFDLPKLAAGMYLIKVQSKNKITTREIVIH